MNYYDMEFMEKYILAKSQTDKATMISLSEPERTVALYAFMKDNDRGTAWEKVITYDYGFLSTISSQEGCGDIRNKNGACIEFKVSYSDKINNYSFWQCRPWEPTTGYFFKCIDRNDNWKHINYFLTKAEFLYELSMCDSLDMTHGRKKDLPGLLTAESAIEWRVELTIRLKSKGKSVERTNRWNKLYQVDDIEYILENIKPDGTI